MPLPPNTVKVYVRSPKDFPNFFFVEGPGGAILSAGPRYDGVDGSKKMSQKEVYDCFEKIIMMNDHIHNPQNYITRNTYLSPDNMFMIAELDMRHKTLDQMKDKIIESTKG